MTSIFLLTGQACIARIHRDLNPLFTVVSKITYIGDGISDFFGMLILMLRNQSRCQAGDGDTVLFLVVSTHILPVHD
jgi:hypothetical protein